MQRLFRIFLLVLCALLALSVETKALNASASGLPTQAAIVYAPFSDGQVLQMACVSAPSFNNSNSMLNRKVSSRGNYNRNSRKNQTSSSGTVLSVRTRTIHTIGASANSRSGATTASSARRGATYGYTAGAADRLGVANIVRTDGPMRSGEQNTVSSGSTNNSFVGDNDRVCGQITPIGDAILPLLLMLALYAAIRFIRRKALANATAGAVATTAAEAE